MRKMSVFNMITLDGFFEGLNHDISWHNVDDEFNDLSIPQLQAVDTIVFGRVTYEMMASYWPTEGALQDDPVVARLMTTTPKLVFSNTLKKVEWQNTRLVNGDAAAEIIKLKQLPGKNMIIFGSGKLTASLTNAGLIDEFRIIVAPVILGNGTSLFKGVDHLSKLELVSSRTFGNGNVLLTYRPGREPDRS
jgi:dihydrofolate reductase